MPRTPSREAGFNAELRAREFLETKGLRTLVQNYSCRRGEIDLIMRQGNILVFVEVRYRKSQHYGSPAETVTRSKQQKIIAAAEHYLLTCKPTAQPSCRFDVVAISGVGLEAIDWIKAAFQVT